MRTTLTLLLTCVLLLGCNKLSFEEFHKHPGIDLRFCNIKTWVDQHPLGTRHNIFTYNEFGDPVSVTSDQGGTGAGYHYFRYDDRHRLAEHEHEFDATWTYHYNENSNQPTGTTIVDAYGREFAETFTWDNKGRIIKTLMTLVSTPFEDEEYPAEEKDYSYDDKNLMGYLWNGTQQFSDIEYSSKPSIYMTNKVWMLVNRNYSKNATIGAATFNKDGLPLTFFPEPPYQLSFLDMNFPDGVISYECR